MGESPKGANMKNNFTMKSLPEAERPYEKCWNLGAEALSDAELLSVILRTGTREESALELSKRILDQPGGKGLTGLYHLSQHHLTSLRGIGKVKAVQLKCIAELSRRIAKTSSVPDVAFTGPDAIAEYFMEIMRHEEQEKVVLVLLNSGGRLLGWEVISLGTCSQALISPKEIYQIALSYHAVSIVLLHNHPGGDPSPSREDRYLTQRVAKSGELIGIRLLDHIIIGDRRYYSFSEEAGGDVR